MTDHGRKADFFAHAAQVRRQREERAVRAENEPVGRSVRSSFGNRKGNDLLVQESQDTNTSGPTKQPPGRRESVRLGPRDIRRR